MSQRRNLTPLVAGLLMVVAGSLLFARNILEWDIPWWQVRLLIPLFFVYLGLAKLIRHYAWDAGRLRQKPVRSSLLGGLFLTTLGAVVTLDMLGYLDSIEFIGRFWPVVIILFGLGKVIDFYRLEGQMQFRGFEIMGLILLVFFGLTMGVLADAHIGLLDLGPIQIGDRDWNLPSRGSSYSWSENAQLDATGLEQLQVANLYGNLLIEGGSQSQIEIELTKTVSGRSRSDAQRLADDIRLQTDREGPALKIETNRSNLGGARRFQTHFVIRVPAHLRITAVNGYGRLRVERMQAFCNLENNRGDLLAESLSGGAVLKNRYETVVARRIGGDLAIENLRGDVVVEEVMGNVTIKTDRRAVRVKQVDGNLALANYHGSVRVEHLRGSANIDALGSSIQLSEIDQPVTLKNSYEGITIQGLKAGLELSTENSRVRLADISGPVRIEANRSEITASTLRSGIRFLGRSTRVTASDLLGPVHIETSLKPVRLEGFQGAVTIQNENGDIEIRTQEVPTQDIVAENKNGDISMSMPAGSSFELSAQARGGSIRSDFGRAARGAGETNVLDETIGSGGPKIRLQTEFSTIRIEKIG